MVRFGDYDVQYIAGQSITLKAGFHVNEGSDFVARIATTTCDNNTPATLITIPSEVNGNSTVNKLIIETNDTAANFKYLLFPFMDGETLPTTKWNSAKNELTVICEGTEQTIAFSEVDGSTRMELVPVAPIIETPAIARNTTNEAETSVPELAIIPQPFADHFKLNYQATTTSDLQLQIVNLLGQKIYAQSWQVVEGFNQLHIPTGNWLAGNYFLQVVENGSVLSNTQLIKQD